MGKRLPPGEAERRAKERARLLWSGEKYKKVAPGNEELWASIAAAFVNGDVTFLEDARAFNDTVSSSGPKKKKNPNPHLAALDLDEMPTEFKELRSGYRAAVMAAFCAAGSTDTAPAYVAAFTTITKAYDHIKLMRGW